MISDKTVVGWREWVGLPELGIHSIKAKVDTGARTSALHAFGLKARKEDGIYRVKFKVHPIQENDTAIINCGADVLDERWVRDSGGHRELRFVIKTALMLNDRSWPIEITLTNRDTMGFRMLLGRTAMDERLIVDPSQSFLTQLSNLQKG